MAKYIYGIDIGGTTVKMGLFDEKGDMLEKWEIVTRKENNGENILPGHCEVYQRKKFREIY